MEINKIKNTQGITKIVMRPTAYTICQLGGDFYKSKLEITFEPNEYYPDYMEVNKFISSEIDGKYANIEDVVESIYDFLQLYEPKKITVVNHVTDCRTHFDVDVVKE